MDRWQATTLILEQAAVLLALVWWGRRFGKWTASRDRATDSTLALITELQKHRATDSIAAIGGVATFVHVDTQEAG